MAQNKLSLLLITVASISFSTMSNAAKFSDLIVVKEAAKAGKWTMSTSGTLPDGKPFPSSTNTVCATKQEVIESLNNPFMWDEKTGEEDSDCPTTLTTNTTTIGIASLSCKMKTISLPGQPPIKLPDTLITTEFKKISSTTWTVKTGNITTNITYHGAATAACVATRSSDKS